MAKQEMIDILRGKVLHESKEEIQQKLDEIADYIEKADAVKHGRWVKDEDGIFYCSECKRISAKIIAATPYCPNCGARMDLEVQNSDG